MQTDKSAIAQTHIPGLSTALLVGYVELVKLLTEKGVLALGEMSGRLDEVSEKLASSPDPDEALRIISIISKAVRGVKND